MNISFQESIIPGLRTVFIDGIEAGEIEDRDGYFLATSISGKSSNQPTQGKAIDYITQFLKKSGQPINQTALF